MADQTPNTPGRNPLDDRLRATFTAELNDVEARHQSRGAKLRTSRSTPWMPLAAAAAVLAIAALAFVGFARNSDRQPVELAITEQPTATPMATDPAPVGDDEPVAPTPPAMPASPPPIATPDEPTVTAAANDCGGAEIMFVPHFVWDVAVDDPDGGLVAHSGPDVDTPVTRVLDYNAAVLPTGVCSKSANGSNWYEIEIPEVGLDWVNARYLRRAEPACLFGESVGVETRDGIRDADFLHTVAPGDFLTSIAAQYNVSIDALLAANPGVDSVSIRVDSLLRIPNQGSTVGTQFQGPLDGWGAYDGNAIAFIVTKGTFSRTYRWHAGDNFTTGGGCGPSALQGSPLCLTGEVTFRESDDGAVTWTGAGPVTAWRAGMTDGILLEVDLLDPAGQLVTGFVDPTETDTATGHCFTNGDDSLDAQPCSKVLQSPDASFSWFVAQDGSSADHVHDLRAESNDECTRVVVEFGSDANGDADATAELMPGVVIDSDAESVIITPFEVAPWEGAFDDPDRVDYPGGVGLLVVSTGFEFSVQFRHQEMEPHVRFMSDPARVVIDLFPVENPDPESHGPSGDNFVLREPIQTDLSGPGVPVDNDIVVAGYGRPFEAQGQYRIWSVPADVDPDAFLVDPPEPLVKEVLRTSSWSDGWGEFFVALPELAPGTYIAVFGDEPPTDEIGFYGSGQLFRIADPNDPTDADYPPAVLLPDVQLPPEPFG